MGERISRVEQLRRWKASAELDAMAAKMRGDAVAVGYLDGKAVAYGQAIEVLGSEWYVDVECDPLHGVHADPHSCGLRDREEAEV